MKNLNKKLLIIPALAIAAVLTYSSAVKADYESFAPWHTQMVQQLAEKLGVSPDDVDTAMNEMHEQMRVEQQVEMENRLEERLQALVDDGTLTEGQREAWLAKHEEWQADREAQRASHQEEMQAWFNEQGIDPTVLGPMGMGMGRGGHGPMISR